MFTNDVTKSLCKLCALFIISIILSDWVFQSKESNNKMKIKIGLYQMTKNIKAITVKNKLVVMVSLYELY